MAGTNRRRDEEPEDPGYEVVDTPAARPVRAKPVAARPVSPPPPKKPKVTVVDDEEDDRPRKRTRPRDEDDDDEDDRPRKKAKVRAVEDDEDEDEDDRPRKKGKKKRKGAKGGVSIDDETNNVLLEWGPAAFMILVGLIMLAVGTWGQTKSPAAEIASPVVAVVVMVGIQFVTIPLTIVALIMIGSVFGIEYGTLTSAVRNLAAMSFLVNGMIAVFQWAGLVFFVYEPIVLLVSIGLFMTLFRLDVWETIVTVVALNMLSWVLNLVALLIIFAMLSKAVRMKEREGDFDSRPKMKQGQGADDNRPWRKGDPDDDFDPDDR